MFVRTSWQTKKVNISNDYNSFRREQVIVWQQHRKDSSCQSLRFFKENLAL